MLVITPYVTGQEPLHESAQRLMMRSFNHKVKVLCEVPNYVKLSASHF
jgi:hypothetical protein